MDRLEGKQTTPKDESGVSGREEVIRQACYKILIMLLGLVSMYLR